MRAAESTTSAELSWSAPSMGDLAKIRWQRVVVKPKASDVSNGDRLGDEVSLGMPSIAKAGAKTPPNAEPSLAQFVAGGHRNHLPHTSLGTWIWVASSCSMPSMSAKVTRWLQNPLQSLQSLSLVHICSYPVFLAQLVYILSALKRLSIMLHKVGSSFSAIRIHALRSSKAVSCDTTGTATATAAASWFIRQCWGVRHGWTLKLEPAHMTSTETLGQFHLASGPAVLRLAS